MITIRGTGVSKGIAKGPLYFFQRPDTTVTRRRVEDLEREKARLAAAQAASIRQLEALAEKCREEAEEAVAVAVEAVAVEAVAVVVLQEEIPLQKKKRKKIDIM